MNLRPHPLTVLYFGLWVGYFSWFWLHVFEFNATGALVVGNPNMWADWALHFTLGNAMLERDLIPDTSPLLLDQPFSYPIAADLLSALLVKAGMGFLAAFVLPGWVCTVLLVAALFYFLKVIFGSPAVAALGGSMFLLAGGLGFLQFAQDVAAAASPLATLLDPPHEYTRLAGTPIVLLSVIDGLILPQRSFTLGFPLALFALGWIHSTLAGTAPEALKRVHWLKLGAAAALLGSLPLVHPHSLLAAFVILSFWAAGFVLLGEAGRPWQRLRPWLFIALATALVALPLIKLHTAEGISGSFFRWFPGWYAKELDVAWPGFWIRNWSLLPLLALAGLALWFTPNRKARERGRNALLFAPFFVLFALVNLIVFAPWIWDNTKLLAWAAVGFSGLAAYFCVRLWQEAAAWPRRQAARRTGILVASYAVRLAVLSAIGVTVASGAIDAWRILRVDRHGNVMYTQEDFRMGRWAREETDPRSVWLTGDQHNHWAVNLTGRQPLMAYRGWLWSTGYDYGRIEADIGRMFATADPLLLARYRVDYAVIGPDERNNWKADEAAFAARFPVARRSDRYTVYRIGPASGMAGRPEP